MSVNQTTLSAFAHFTKRLYIDRDGVTNVANHAHPLWDMIDHSLEDTWVGDGNAGWSQAWGRNQADGADISVVEGNIDNNKGSRFNFTSRPTRYGATRLTGEVMAATRNNRGAIEKATKDHIEQTVQTMKDRLALYLYLDGSGALGQRSGALSGNIMTLANPDDAKNFQQGQWVESSNALTGTSVNSGAIRVKKVTWGRTTSTVEFYDASLSVGFAASDYLFNASDKGAIPMGLEGWNPLTDPSSGESFFGVDRSDDNLRLAGHRLVGTGYGTYKEVAQDLAIQMSRVGSSKGQKAGFINPLNWGALEKDLGTKATRSESGKATFGYQSIIQQSAVGEIEWFADPDCPTNRMRICEPKDVFVLSLGRVPHVMDEDGLIFRKVSGADAWQVNWRAWVQFGLRNPVKHGVASITATS